MVITLDFESSDPGSNPGRTFFLREKNFKNIITHKMSTVGFEPTPPKRLAPEASALDHSAKLTVYNSKIYLSL